MLGAEGGCSAPWKWGYNIHRIYLRARIIKNLSETALHAVFKVSPDSTTHIIERFNKGAWGVSLPPHLPAGPVCSRCGCCDSNCIKSLLVTIYMLSSPFRWVQKRKKTNMIFADHCTMTSLQTLAPQLLQLCDCLVCPLSRNINLYFCAFRYFTHICFSLSDVKR